MPPFEPGEKPSKFLTATLLSARVSALRIICFTTPWRLVLSVCSQGEVESNLRVVTYCMLNNGVPCHCLFRCLGPVPYTDR